MNGKRNADIQMRCPWLTEVYGVPADCIRERCPYYDIETKTVVIEIGKTKTYSMQSCIRVHQQSVELEIVANIFRELKKLLDEEVKNGSNCI